MVNIEEIAKQTCNKYYTQNYVLQPAIDLDNILVQIEDFEWNGASYRMDVFFLHQKPSFIPYHQNFWMAHRMWMTKSGNTIRQEPVYSSNAVHPELNSRANENIVGLFPGNYYFKNELDFIDRALKNNTSPLLLKSGPKGLFQHIFHFKNGITDLERVQAYIIQLSHGYSIAFEGEKYDAFTNQPSGLSMYHISFIISNEGQFSGLTSTIRIIPGLC